MNGFTTITINGESVGIMFGMYANRVFAERKQNAKYYSGDSLNELGIAALLHAGYENHCVLEDKEGALSLKDFSSYVDEMTITGETEEIKRAVETWSNSHFIKKSIERLKDQKEVKKKKPTSTNSKK